MTDEIIKESKCIETAKLIKNILEHLMPEYNPIKGDGSVESAFNTVLSRAKLALFHTNAIFTEIETAERLAKIEVLEEVLSVIDCAYPKSEVISMISELKEGK